METYITDAVFRKKIQLDQMDGGLNCVVFFFLYFLFLYISVVLMDNLSAVKHRGGFRTNLMEGALGFLPGAKNNG